MSQEIPGELTNKIVAVMVAEGALPRLRELQRLLAKENIEAKVFSPPGQKLNS